MFTSPINVNIDGDDPIEIVNETYAVTNISCDDGNDGKIELVVIGGDSDGDFSYSWTGPNGYTASSETSLVFQRKELYTVEISRSGCSITKEF